VAISSYHHRAKTTSRIDGGWGASHSELDLSTCLPERLAYTVAVSRQGVAFPRESYAQMTKANLLVLVVLIVVIKQRSGGNCVFVPQLFLTPCLAQAIQRIDRHCTWQWHLGASSSRCKDYAASKFFDGKGAGGHEASQRQIDDNVEQDTISSEKYMKELSKVCWEMFRATGAMFEQEHLRFIFMYMAANVFGGCGPGGVQSA
jgi:hypothetical protein